MLMRKCVAVCINQYVTKVKCILKWKNGLLCTVKVLMNSPYKCENYKNLLSTCVSNRVLPHHSNVPLQCLFFYIQTEFCSIVVPLLKQHFYFFAKVNIS